MKTAFTCMLVLNYIFQKQLTAGPVTKKELVFSPELSLVLTPGVGSFVMRWTELFNVALGELALKMLFVSSKGTQA